MRFKVDENLPAEAAALLREAGHDVHTVRDEGLSGAPDPRIAEACRSEGRALLTLDTDFANIFAYPPEGLLGVVVLRLSRQDKTHVLEVLAGLVPLLNAETLTGRLWIVDERRVRVHGSET